jgi:hypothetical protein
MLPQAPVDCLVVRLEGVRGTRPKVRATCPNCGRKGALSVAEGRDGAALAKCHAGCELRDIAGAVALRVTDLFPPKDPERLRERDALRCAYRATPRTVVKNTLATELARVRARLRAEHGYERPLRAADHNAARRRVAAILGIAPLAVVEPFAWECAPHDSDPAWPALFMRALDEAMRDRWQAFWPEAEPWEVDPNGPNRYDHLRAEILAHAWLRALSRAA